MRLYLDPRSPDGRIIVGIWKERAKRPRFFEYVRGEISLLGFISKLTRSASDITGIAAVPGPGNFSSVRTSAVFANILSFSAHTPVVQINPKSGESMELSFFRGIEKLKKAKLPKQIRPLYGKPPNITKPKCG